MMNGCLILLEHNDVFNNLSLHRLGELGAFDKLLGFLKNGLVFLFDDFCVFLFKVYADLVVNEGQDHAVMDWDEVGWLVLGVLAGALHEDEGSVGRHLVLALFGDEPALLLGVGDVAVVSGNCFQLDLNLTLH